MSKTATYTQCTLVKSLVGTIYTYERMVWIPSQFAELGDTLKLKNNLGEWSEGWLVRQVWQTLPAEAVERNARDHRRVRKHSDIERGTLPPPRPENYPKHS